MRQICKYTVELIRVMKLEPVCHHQTPEITVPPHQASAQSVDRDHQELGNSNWTMSFQF